MFLLLLCIIQVSFSNQYYMCEIGNPLKCLGDIKTDFGYAGNDAKLIKSIKADNKNSCFTICSSDKECKMAIYSNINKTFPCNLYSNIDMVQSNKETTMIFMWYCCNLNKTDTKINSCPGFWKHQDNEKTNNLIRNNDPIVNTTVTGLYSCLQLCLDTPICGAVNYYVLSSDSLNNLCELIIQNPTSQLIMSYNYSWSSYIWVCSSNYKLPKLSNTKHLRPGYLPGFWDYENQTAIKIDLDIATVLNFYTGNLQDCLSNCEFYIDCVRVWYSKNAFLCVLEANSKSLCADKLDNDFKYDINDMFYTFIWKTTVRNFVDYHNDGIYDSNKEGSCRKILDNNNLLIYNISCGELPSDQTFLHKCNSPIIKLKFTQNLHCQNYQAFRVIKFGSKSINVKLNLSSSVNWMLVSSGFENFWLGNVSEINFPIVKETECETYNSDFRNISSDNLKIVSRSDWYTNKYRERPQLFPQHMVDYVIITDTERPFCNCFSRIACDDKMRQENRILQNTIFFGWPYNFVIMGDGTIYEGRGWKYKNAAAAAYNMYSFSIALLGRYSNHAPTPISLYSLKKLILNAVKSKKLSPNYTILLHNDVSSIFVDQLYLEKVIYLYPKYLKYDTNTCRLPSIQTIIINGLMAILEVILFVCIIHYFYYRLLHNKFCKNIQKCRIESIYGSGIKKSIEILPHIILHNIKMLTQNNVLISPFTSQIFWIEKKPLISLRRQYGNFNKTQCKCWKAVETVINMCKFQSNMVDVNYITLLSELNNCQKQLYIIFQRHPEIDGDNVIILHLDSKIYFYNFINQLYSQICVCDNFLLTKYEPNCRAFTVCHKCTSFNSTHRKETFDKQMPNQMLLRNKLQNQYTFLKDNFSEVQFYKL